MSWRCFYCDETFKNPGEASDHFGNNMMTAEPGCLIDYRVQLELGGTPQRGRGLLMALRRAEAELDAYRQEDTELHRAMWGMQAEHRTALVREEEKGYAKGLKDARLEPIEMILHCPTCQRRHVDEEEWRKIPHRSHLCDGCGCVWRPADVPTIGVKSITTHGRDDTVTHLG